MSLLLEKRTSDNEANEANKRLKMNMGFMQRHAKEQKSVSTKIIRVYCCFLNIATTEGQSERSLYLICQRLSMPVAFHFMHYNIG